METIAAKVPRDLADEIEEYRAEHDLNTSQAMRRLLEDGVEAQEPDRTVSIAVPLLITGAFMIGASPYVQATGYVAEFGIGMIALAFLLESTRVRRAVQVLKTKFTRTSGSAAAN